MCQQIIMMSVLSVILKQNSVKHIYLCGFCCDNFVSLMMREQIKYSNNIIHLNPFQVISDKIV